MESDNMMVLQNKIGELFRLLRGEIRAENYTVILLFIYLRSTNLFSDITQNEENQKESLIEVLKNTNDTTLQKIFNVFLPVINNLSKQLICDVLELLKSVDSDSLNENISEIYDDTLNRITLSQSRVNAEFMQPKQLTEFINAYVGSTKHLKIYNPFAGFVSLIKNINRSKSIYAQEKNLKTWAVGQLRLIVSRSNAVYNCDDSIMNWPTNEKFDLIVSNPPFMLKLNGANKDKYPEFINVEDFLLGMSLKSLSDNGKLITVLPTGVLFRARREREIRERLIQDDLLDTIISFPSGLLHYTSVPFVVMILNKAKENSEKIKLVNAAPFVSKPSERESFISVNELLQAVNGNESDSVRIISNQDVINNNFNLNIARYFVEEIDGVRLSDILKPQRGTRVKPQETGKMIRIRDLKNDTIDFHLNTSESEEILLDRPDFRKIESSCILLAKRWKTLKPTFFQFQNEPIYIASDVFAFHVDESKVDINYLVNELHSDYVQQQIEGYSTGATIPSIALNDLLEIKIKLLSIDEQRAKVTGLKEISDKILQLQHERNTLAHGMSLKLYENSSTLKHSLGTPLLNIGSALENIEYALSAHYSEWKDIKLDSSFDISIKDTFESIYSNLKFVHSELEKNESAFDVNNYELTEIEFIKFIKDYVKRNKSSANPNVSVNLVLHADIKNQLKNSITILSNIKLLEIGLNSIVENANKHGFVDPQKKYKLEFRVGLSSKGSEKNQSSGGEKQYVKVEVSNNGKPFPNNFGLDSLIRKNSFAGKTGNTGQGGFDLNEIVKYFNNGFSTLDLITNDEISEFSTTYLFLIPLNH
jgi:type I restriction enzyme M protein